MKTFIRTAVASMAVASVLAGATAPAFAQRVFDAPRTSSVRGGGPALTSAYAVSPAPATPATAPQSNTARVEQQGAGHAAGVLQEGAGNTGTIIQYGQSHTATLQQYGTNNTGCVVQLGRGQSVDMTQSGANLSAGVAQAHGQVEALPAGMCGDPSKKHADYQHAFRSMRKARLLAAGE